MTPAAIVDLANAENLQVIAITDHNVIGNIREAVQYASKLTGKDRAFVAMLYNDLGDVAYRSGNLNEAERLDRAAIDEYRRLPEAPM